MPPAPGEPIRIAVGGLGKIARDQHLPALLADDRFAVTATVDPAGGGVEGIAHLRRAFLPGRREPTEAFLD